MKHGVPQGSVLGPLLFLIYINDLNSAIKYCRVQHFADDTNLLISNKSPKVIQKYINLDLKNLCKWLRANKISLNTSKTELLVFKHPNKKINYEFKIKMNGKKLYPSKFVKYLGILIDCQLNFSYHISSLSNKLARAIGMLSKIRHYVTKDTLRSIYFGIFSSILIYGSQIWGIIRSNHFIRLERLQNKAVKIINFANFRDPILPLSDNIRLLNFLHVLDDIKHNLPPALEDTFQLIANSHDYPTRRSVQHNVAVPAVRTTIYGIKSIKFQSCQDWNFFVNYFKDNLLHTKSKSVCKKIISNFFFNNY